MSVTKVTSMMSTGTKGGDIPSASTLVIDTDGDYFDITGTTGITAMTVDAGRRFTLQFDGAVVLTHGGSLYIPGAVNFTTEANDSLDFIATAANTVRCTGYALKDGGSIVASTPAVHYFDAHLNSNLALSDSADTKVTGLTENQDSSGWFASDRFTPQLAGRYWIMASGELGTGSGSSLWHNGNCSVKRNGTAVTLPTYNNYASYTGQQKTHTSSVIVNMNGSSDYVEMYVNLNVTSGSHVCVGASTGNTRFCGFYIGA